MIRSSRYYGTRSPQYGSAPEEKHISPGAAGERRASPALAMAYIPEQEYENLYTPAEALTRGTLFKQLDMPFHGCFRI